MAIQCPLKGKIPHKHSETQRTETYAMKCTAFLYEIPLKIAVNIS